MTIFALVWYLVKTCLSIFLIAASALIASIGIFAFDLNATTGFSGIEATILSGCIIIVASFLCIGSMMKFRQLRARGPFGSGRSAGLRF